jgi:outer membrane receptor protein involved in Fe transport
MRARVAIILPVLAFASPALADSGKSSVNIRAQPLDSALQELARQTSSEVLFDSTVIGSRQSVSIRGKFTIDAALERLLRGTGLTVRRTAGAWIIEPQAVAAAAPQELAVPEILIVGKRTQNFDIRRRETDVQPYRVTEGATIIQAHRDNIDQYFQSRITANTQTAPPSLLTNGATNSSINLRGLGTDSTLVLIDGRRLPSIPASVFGFQQPDLNAIPLHSIDRVETLTGTAGGIYGFGALGGVVNVVLKRDYRGVELYGTTGISSRGDAFRLSLEGGAGFTPDGGKTDVMVYVSHVRDQPLLVGDRDFNQLDRRQAYSRLQVGAAPTVFEGNSVGVFAAQSGQALVFKPQYGGLALGSSHTFLPSGFAGGANDLVSALTASTGLLDPLLGDGENASEIGSSQTSTSAIVNVRHHFGTAVEAYVDALVLRNRGRSISYGPGASLFLAPNNAINPFNQAIVLTFPIRQQILLKETRYDSALYTAGLIANLPFNWRGTAEATFGSATYATDTIQNMFYSGAGNPSKDPNFNPLGNWDAFQRATAALRYNGELTSTIKNRYQEQSLRLAGPIFRTAGGPAGLTLLFEHRRENIPGYSQASSNTLSGTNSDTIVATKWRTGTTSLYAELKSRLFGENAKIPLLRGFEVQFALRRDAERVAFTSSLSNPNSALTDRTFIGTAYTAGAKVFPLPWLMLRASYATGAQPPGLTALASSQINLSLSTIQDPKRPRANLTERSQYPDQSGGSSLATIQANTLSLGFVLNPTGRTGPRLALDYSLIRKTGDVFRLNANTVLANEDRFPGRVIRAPLTDADRALGYTGGRVITIDDRSINAVNVTAELIDGRLDWDLSALRGTLHLYGAATLALRDFQRGPLDAGIDFVGYRDGPLKWRANGGIDWTRGATTVGANLQFFDRYRVYPTTFASSKDQYALAQGSYWIPSQTYLDLYFSRRFRVGRTGREFQVDLGVEDVLDSSPPRELNYSTLGAGYSLYGDPRRRRFELGVSARL